MDGSLVLKDEILAQRALKGNTQAFNLLLTRYNSKIKQIVCFYIVDNATANDLTQDVLLKLFLHLSDFKGESNFTTWMYRIIQNTLKNYFRAMELRHVYEERFANEYLSAQYHSPEYEVMNFELDVLINSAIEQLSSELQICYGMYFMEGQTYQAIAQKIHCPLGTVRSRIFRAKKMILDYVEDGLHRN